jgi:hypothetical protein
MFVIIPKISTPTTVPQTRPNPPRRVVPPITTAAIASSSLVTEWVKGKTLDEAGTIKNSQIAQELALPPVKIHCSILAEDAIKAAIADYREKH